MASSSYLVSSWPSTSLRTEMLVGKGSSECCDTASRTGRDTKSKTLANHQEGVKVVERKAVITLSSLDSSMRACTLSAPTNRRRGLLTTGIYHQRMHLAPTMSLRQSFLRMSTRTHAGRRMTDTNRHVCWSRIPFSEYCCHEFVSR